MVETGWSKVTDESFSETLVWVAGIYASSPRLSALLLEASRRIG